MAITLAPPSFDRGFSGGVWFLAARFWFLCLVSVMVSLGLFLVSGFSVLVSGEIVAECMGLALKAGSQAQHLHQGNLDAAQGGVKITLPSSGGAQSMICLPLCKPKQHVFSFCVTVLVTLSLSSVPRFMVWYPH
ncbi:MAG: hypothetical protein ACRDDA_13460 [Aeromonas sp.]